MAALLAVLSPLAAEDRAVPLGDPQADPPTLECLGAYWLVGGDADGDARIESAWRRPGEAGWRPAMPLWRVEAGRHLPEKHPPSVVVPAGAALFAGSLLGLAPDTDYEWKLTLSDPDGGTSERVLTARTTAEPVLPRGAMVRHVAPGDGAGDGTPERPFRGLAAAQAAARPGMVFLLHAGTYPPFTVTANGEPGKPLVWRGAGDGEVVIDGARADGGRAGRGISASEVHDVWFEDLTVRNADYAIVGHESARVVVRGCHLHRVEFGIAATRNDRDGLSGWFIADNLLEGPSTWPRTKGIENARGVQITGAGHVVTRNRIRGFADAIDTFPSRRVVAIDISDNELSECTDDGIELDYSHRNTRAFRNRVTNAYQGLSLQPIHGGPGYLLRNVLVNVCVEPFKLHNHPSGVVIMHNTVLKQGPPLAVSTAEPVSRVLLRNNLFVGSGGRACDFDAPAHGCDFDSDGYVGWSGEVFLKWNGQKYATPADVRQRAPIYRNLVTPELAGLFASGAVPPLDRQAEAGMADLRLGTGSGAIDAGLPIPGIDDGFRGAAPDLGAYELGDELPAYGPRARR
jgi:hypothetical protein